MTDTTDKQAALESLRRQRRQNALDAHDTSRRIDWPTSSPQPTMRQTRRIPPRVEHLQRRDNERTLRMTDHGETITWVCIENPTWVLTYNHVSYTWLAIVGSTVTLISVGSRHDLPRASRAFFALLPVGKP